MPIVTGIFDADPGTGGDRTAFQLPVLDPKLPSREADPVQFPVDFQRLTKFTGTASDIGNATCPRTIPLHQVDAVKRFDGTDQDRSGKALLFGHRVQAVVEAVDHVHIGASGWAEHHLGSPRAPLRRVTGEVVRTDVGLRLDDDPRSAAASKVADEDLSDQISCNLQCRPSVELLPELLHDFPCTSRDGGIIDTAARPRRLTIVPTMNTPYRALASID